MPIGNPVAAELGNEVDVIPTNPNSMLKFGAAKMLLEQRMNVTTQQESDGKLSGDFNCCSSGLEQRGASLVVAGAAPAPVQAIEQAPPQPASDMSHSA